MPEPIRSHKLIAVEGNDEIQFFKAFLRHIGCTDYDIREVGGKDQFKRKLPALVKTTGFSGVEAFAIIRDADKDALSSFDSVRNILRNVELDASDEMNKFSKSKPSIGVYIMPGNSKEGMLEDLCLKTVKDHPTMKCVDPFVQCIMELDEHPHNLSKAKAQAFLAAMPEIANSVGLGAQKGYWGFDSPELESLKKFFKNFMEL